MALRGGEPDLVLYGFRFSHPCVSVQLMIEHKRLSYHYKELAPGLHPERRSPDRLLQCGCRPRQEETTLVGASVW
jgi:hypothetical protein